MINLSFLRNKPWKEAIIKNWLLAWLLLGLYFLLCGITVLEDSSTYHRFFYLFIIPPAAIILINNFNLKLLSNHVIILYLGFIATVFVSTSINTPDELTNSIKRALYTLSLFIVTAFALHKSKKHTFHLTLLAGLTVLASSLYSYIPFLESFIKTGVVPGRFIGSGSLSNPLLSSHIFGFYTVVFSLIAIYSKEVRLKLLLSLAALSFFILTLSTGSRTPLLALASTVLWLALLKLNKKSALILIGLALATALLWLISPESITNRGLSYRPELWATAIEKIKYAPFLGYGFNAPASFYIDSLDIHFREPHNIHLSVMYFTGLIGFFFWASMHIVAIVFCIKHKKQPIFILASSLLIYGIAAGMTEGGGLLPRPKEHWFITWIPLALASALISYQNNFKNSASSSTYKSLLPKQSSS